MAQNENPLDKLKDIHLPEQIDGFVMTPGWWIILLLLALIIIYFVIKQIKKRKALALLKPLAVEIAELKSKQATTDSLAKLSALIKRIALVYYPQSQVASLTGNNWITFLNAEQPQHQFTNQQIHWITEFVYQKEVSISNSNWHDLLEKSHQLLTAIVKTKALSKHSQKATRATA